VGERREGRTELERAGWAIHWEQVRVAYFTRLNHHAKAQQCRELVEKWQQRQAQLFEEAQKG